MALKKGFLWPTIVASTATVQLGVALGTVSSFLLYYFFYHFREAIRQFDINFLAEFPLLLVLIPVVLFLNAWTLTVKAFGGKAYRWFLYTTVYLSLLNVVYANINSIDYQQVN